jgi:hypothetical protein
MSCEHFLEIPPFDDEISSARITMNRDQWRRKRSTATGVSAVYQINRGESRSNQAFGSRPNAWACEVKLPLCTPLNGKHFWLNCPVSNALSWKRNSSFGFHSSGFVVGPLKTFNSNREPWANEVHSSIWSRILVNRNVTMRSAGCFFPEEWPEILHDFARTIKHSKC